MCADSFVGIVALFDLWPEMDGEVVEIDLERHLVTDFVGMYFAFEILDVLLFPETELTLVLVFEFLFV